MMVMLMSLLMLIPLSFLGDYWIMMFIFSILSFIFLKYFSFGYLTMSISYVFGIDMLSFLLIILSFWICMLMFLASEKIYKLNNFYSLFIFVMLILMISLYLTFVSLNLFVFYLFFEISLVPTLLLIIGWGYQPERIEAGMYLLFYTLFASLPMMISIFWIYKNFGSLDFSFMTFNLDYLYMYMLINMVFLIKMPMFFVHLWLPKAHVEAPVSGSMILAGIMLKLGGYGMMRMMPLFLKLGKLINMNFIVISMIGGMIVSLICLRQSDMKSLIAYSSVAHMGMVLSGIMTLNLFGLWGALILMLAHGLCSSGLFCLANLCYERSNSRSLYLNKGLLSIMPSMSMWWFLLSSSNMAAPPSLNLLGEIVLINSLVVFSNLMMLMLMLISFFSAVYSLFLYSYSQHGLLYSGNYSYYMCYSREFLLMFLHWVPLNLLIFKSENLSLWI